MGGRKYLWLVLFLLIQFSSCEKRQQETNSYTEISSISINHSGKLDSLIRIAKYYLYVSGYGLKGDFLVSPTERDSFVITELNLDPSDVSFLSRDSFALSFTVSINDIPIVPNPNIETQVLFNRGKVIGLGGGNYFIFFDENPEFCKTLNDNRKALLSALNSEKSYFCKWLIKNKNFIDAHNIGCEQIRILRFMRMN